MRFRRANENASTGKRADPDGALGRRRNAPRRFGSGTCFGGLLTFARRSHDGNPGEIGVRIAIAAVRVRNEGIGAIADGVDVVTVIGRFSNGNPL